MSGKSNPGSDRPDDVLDAIRSWQSNENERVYTPRDPEVERLISARHSKPDELPAVARKQPICLHEQRRSACRYRTFFINIHAGRGSSPVYCMKGRTRDGTSRQYLELLGLLGFEPRTKGL